MMNGGGSGARAAGMSEIPPAVASNVSLDVQSLLGHRGRLPGRGLRMLMPPSSPAISPPAVGEPSPLMATDGTPPTGWSTRRRSKGVRKIRAFRDWILGELKQS
jgi:hypothetical protein